MNFFKNEYRIVADDYLGYEVQIRYWWFPKWVQATSYGQFANTHRSIEKAEAWANKHSKEHVLWHHAKSQKSVKYLGRLP